MFQWLLFRNRTYQRRADQARHVTPRPMSGRQPTPAPPVYAPALGCEGARRFTAEGDPATNP
ncbi:hypothetical protein LTV02_17365 [Nocardia yamanashiensis]|uniref:hypothetical protein n=1 Tax=Nocardia yamanashiensis TaxID=209247 RepID=UPI001E3AB75A|nr:hypothetical protein [Nocardia yamanashiensis]UGT45044.1 hypothetical protein LTV02_17365 [Nocardia yamanashiensis]